jgi:hypothetical protein
MSNLNHQENSDGQIPTWILTRSSSVPRVKETQSALL